MNIEKYVKESETLLTRTARCKLARIVNRVVCDRWGIDICLAKKDMTPEMLIDRESIAMEAELLMLAKVRTKAEFSIIDILRRKWVG